MLRTASCSHTAYTFTHVPPLIVDYRYNFSGPQLRRGRLQWTACSDLPVGMYQANGVCIDGKVYVGGGVTENDSTNCLVFVYHPREDSWDALPPSPVSLFGLGSLFGELVLVGGKNRSLKTTNKVYCYDKGPRMWKQSVPQLVNPRYSPTVVTYQSLLLACGGLVENLTKEVSVVTSVEVINAESYRWYVAGYLPRSASLSKCSSVAIRDTCYIMGGYSSSLASSATQSTHHTSLSSVFSNSSLTPYMWQSLSDTPHCQTTGATLGGCLLALGGCSKPYTVPHRSIHAYCAGTKSWIFVGDLPYASCHCTAVSLPSGELLVIGGWVEPGKNKRATTVYRGRVVL